jgi:RHS repeat-associated protein
MKSGLEVETFHYDANGNRLESTSTQEGQSTYQYDPTRNRLLSYQDDNLHAVTSDANGNITSMGDLSFTYDVFNNLTTVSKAGKMLAHYIYNALNQRVLKQVDDQKTIFIYDQAGKLIEIRGPDSIIDIIYLDDEPIAEVIDGEVYYFVNDRLGTPQYLLGQNGRADWSANILPFRVAAQGSVMQDLRFPGQVEDKESHLVYNNAREYVPHLGRYLQPDPLGLGGGSLNPYTYADNNPVNVTDPTGKNFVIQGLIMGARLAGSAIARVTPASVTNTARAALNTARTAINNYSRKTLPEQVAKITQADKEGQVCSWAERDFTGLRGGSGYELKNAPYQTTRNDPATINGRDYSGHALDQMQNRGVMPSAIENTITTGKIFPTQSGTTGYYDSTNNIRVIVNSETGKVVTTIRGTP